MFLGKCRSSLIRLDLVVLLLIPDLAAARPRPFQPRPLDLHARVGAIEALLVPGDRVPVRHSDLLERQEGFDGSANSPHAQVLLLGGESKVEEWHYTQGFR